MQIRKDTLDLTARNEKNNEVTTKSVTTDIPGTKQLYLSRQSVRRKKGFVLANSKLHKHSLKNNDIKSEENSYYTTSHVYHDLICQSVSTSPLEVFLVR